MKPRVAGNGEHTSRTAASVAAARATTTLGGVDQYVHGGDLLLVNHGAKLTCIGGRPEPLCAGRADGSFTTAHQGFWDAARRALGDADGTRALVGALLLQRTLPAVAFHAAMTAAVTTGRFEADLLAVTARAHLAAARTPAAPIPLPPGASRVATLTRPTPSLAGYDQLLNGEPA